MGNSLSNYYDDTEGVSCNWCGSSLDGIEFEMYDHSAGVEVEGYDHPQWLYKTCRKCGYQWAYWKLVKRSQRKKQQGGDIHARKMVFMP